ncbi:MAG: cell division protein SepF [Fimbriimonas sp.]
MEETMLQDKPGFFGRIAGIFTRSEEFEDDQETTYERVGSEGAMQLRPNYRYTVTVRRQITVFEDAMAAANGLKRGEQQILNLTSTDPLTRQKIVDFMSGVNYAQEGTWEEIGENVYLIVPANAYVEVAPPTPRMNATRN